jgi:hypothetical protein
MRDRFYPYLFAVALLATTPLFAQAPMPIVTPMPTKVVQAPAPAAVTTTDTTASNLKALRDFKAANDEILKRQKTALETLDELQKAADQIKMYTKRS